MADFLGDLRVAARRLRHAPGFVLVTVLSLTMAIAANLVVFGVMNAAVLRPLNVANADRLMMIEHKEHGYTSQSYPDYQDFRTRNSTFSAMAAYRINDVGLSAGGPSGGGLAHKSWIYEVSGNYFDMLGVGPELGRMFHANDEHGPNSAPYIVLSDSFWRAHFGGDPRVIGEKVDLNKHPFTIVGVAPATFHGTEIFLWPDFYVPMVNEEQLEGYDFLTKRFNHGIFAIGSMKPGVTVEQATQDLNRVAAQMAKQNPQADDGLVARLVKPGLLGDVLGDASREFLTGILVLALLVLAAACVNLASIFAARAADRGRELAIRMAIGSSRWRMLRQVLAEAALLSAAGGLVGAMAAAMLLRVLSEWQPIAAYPIHVTVVADARVYVLAVLLAAASGILPALLTARQIWKTDAMQAIKAGASQQVVRRLTLRDVLLGLQVALCALLVTCGLVGLRGMQRQLHAPMGFEPEGAMLVEAEMNMAGYSDDGSLPVQKKMMEDAEQIPGVTAAATMNNLPLSGGGSSTPVYRQGTTDFRDSNSVASPMYYSISPGLLATAGTRLLAGRDFTWHDDDKSPKVAIVNETLAHALFGNAPAVGKYFAMPGPKTYEVVGVVENGKYVSLTENPQGALYYPLAQSTDNDTTLVVRSARAPAEMAAALSTMMNRIDPSLPVTVETWPDALALALFPARVATVALGVLGLLAAMLAITGIFGMASYTVARRLREMGIRVALGAQRLQVLRSALGRTVLLLGVGSAAGLMLGVLGSRVLASIVYEATVYDPVVLSGAIVSMVLIGILAAAVPARRAVSVEPAVLLREE
ncbi:MAG TPA: ABC transporter permease [Acidobacteriaceae bacterium]|nr:ABC transporter permease [Acidobacteriaceae bacterium]